MSNKEKRDAIPGVTMQELIDRGEMNEFAHLEELSDEKEHLKKLKEWLKDGEE